MFVQACSTLPDKEFGAQITARYTPPATYQDHRDQQQKFTTSTGTIAYTDHGEGPTLILLHGVPSSSWMYRKIIPELQDNVRVISVDLLGFGSSEKPDDANAAYALRDHSTRLEELLASLDVENYALLVHDMGGLVGWELMRDKPDAITHLVVLNTIVNDEGFVQPSMSDSPFSAAMAEMYALPVLSEALITSAFNNLGLKDEYALTEVEIQGYVLPVREGSSPALDAFFSGLDDDLFARLDENKTELSNYNGETLVMWGAKDELLTTRQIPILQTMLDVPDSNILTYADNAHFLAEEIPEEIVSRVTDFMAE